MTSNNVDSLPDKPRRVSPPVVIVLLVVALFAGVLYAKAMSGRTTGAGVGEASTGAQAGAETITSVHNDAVVDYEAALKTGKPIYLLFHSLSCQPCVEISAVADEVMPEYEGKVVFVNAISDDAPAQQLAAQFQFQYIPTSFFIAPDGQVVDSFTGAMDASKMRGYLDVVAGAE